MLNMLTILGSTRYKLQVDDGAWYLKKNHINLVLNNWQVNADPSIWTPA